jgi:hypothetical protein
MDSNSSLIVDNFLGNTSTTAVESSFPCELYMLQVEQQNLGMLLQLK